MTTGPQVDSEFFMKEKYTNVLGKTTEIGTIESIVFNIRDEITHIINTGKMGWVHNKVIFPFEESYRNDLGDTLFEKIQKSSHYWNKWNP